MAEPIDTGNKTISGRTIWNDPETGVDYSERSTTFEIEGKYYTMPTVSEDGIQYTDDQIRDYVKEHGAIDYITGEKFPEFRYIEDAIQYAKSRSNTRKPKMAKGGLTEQTEEALTPTKQVGIGSVSSARQLGEMGSISPADATNALDVLAEENKPEFKPTTKIETPLFDPKTNPDIKVDSDPLVDDVVTNPIDRSLRPVSRPEADKIKRMSPIDAVVNSGYLLGDRNDEGITKVVTGLDENNPEQRKAINGMFDSVLGASANYDSRLKAWCATFVSHILNELGADPLKSKDVYDRTRADKYKNYGTKVNTLEDIKEGDVVVLDFDGDGKGDHVGFYAGTRVEGLAEPGYINIVGGNQGGGNQLSDPDNPEYGGAVTIRSNVYQTSAVVAIRRITYDDVTYEFNEELAKEDPKFQKFVPSELQTAQLKKETVGYYEGGLTEQTEEALTPVPYTEDDVPPPANNDQWFDTAIEAGSEPLSEAVEIFKKSGSGAVFNMLPEDSPRLIRALNRTNDYFAGLGYGTYKAGEAAAKFVVGAIADGLGQDKGEVLRGTLGSEKQAYNDIMAMPDAFGGMVGGKSVQLLDDAVDSVGSFVSGMRTNNTLEKVAGALPKYDPNTMGSMGGNLFAGNTSPPKPAGFNPKPKSQVNPLIKVNTGESTLDFYSSIPSALENLPVSKDGIAGSNVIAFLNKRAPNVNKTELYWSGLLETIDPSKKYTKAELLNLSEKQTPKLEIETLTGNSTVYGGTVDKNTQRVPLVYPKETYDQFHKRIIEDVPKLEPGKGGEYVEFLIKNNNSKRHRYDISKEEWSDPTVVAHARGSYNTDVDGNDFFLLEEIQSAAVQGNTVATPAAFRANQIGDVNFKKHYTESLNDLIVRYSNVDALDFNPKFIKYAKDKYGVDGNAINSGEELELFVKKSTVGLIEDFSTLKKDFLDGKQTSEDISKFLQKKYGIKKSTLEKNNIYNLEPLDNMFANIITSFVYKKNDIAPNALEEGLLYGDDMVRIFADPIFEDDFNPLVPMKLSESIKVSLLAVIKDAKKRGVDKIYVPPNTDIEKVHSLGVEPTKNTYTDGLTKVLNTLKSETNGAITSKRNNPQGISYDSGETGLEIDITNFNIPENAQIRFNKGGSVANMARQTEMMFEEGGIADDGMTQDPVSGNEIPPGSLAEEVRDDIPAQLSEGEYVVPADVVRYYGVKFFENLRTKAKMGLQDMEEGGRIGGEPAAMPDDSSISDEELQQIIQEEMNAATQQAPMMNMGGVVEKPTMYMAPGGLSTTTPGGLPTTTPGGLPTTTQPTAYTPPTMSGPMQSVAYYNAKTKETRYFMFINGKINPPGTVIPAGFTKQDGTGQQEPVTPEPVVPVANNDNDDPPKPPPPPADYSSWAKDPTVFTTDPDKWAKSILDGADATKNKVLKAGGLAAFLNPVAGAMLAIGAKYSPQESIATIKARALIETAAGNTEAAAQLNATADKYAETQPGIANFFGNIFSSAAAQANGGVFKQLGFDGMSAEDIAADPAKSNVVKDFLAKLAKPKPAAPVEGDNDPPNWAGATDAGSAAQLASANVSEGVDPNQAAAAAVAGVQAGVSAPTAASAAAAGATSIGSGTASTVEETGNTSGAFNKGGLMTKKKKQR